ncbi:claudin-12 [Lethenteron reissneri]|uniref:claudin-12 n=1 Tax=Lethenteron reissneri TaxID=7753 RepID=UPI002AB755A9|nr:claudin-12 [Lethenteron reissneri]XP_061409245.1 claudin-12 [Lethenteron reissneri]XP_061409251.1 claudin-12 [Lethenteron reissneri]XP_061409260.1 claudin-12 [Lethenteron reissneri]
MSCGGCFLVLWSLCGAAALCLLVAAALMPSWRDLILVDPTKRSIVVRHGLWVRCAGYEGDVPGGVVSWAATWFGPDSGKEGEDGGGSRGCVVRDSAWPIATDSLDLRLLQLGVPTACLVALVALALNVSGAVALCRSGRRSGRLYGEDEDSTSLSSTSSSSSSEFSSKRKRKKKKAQQCCQFNPCGCQVVASVLYLLASALVLPPALWALLSVDELNRAHVSGDARWRPGEAVPVCLAACAGLLAAAGGLAMWYCTCRPLPPAPLPPAPLALGSLLGMEALGLSGRAGPAEACGRSTRQSHRTTGSFPAGPTSVSSRPMSRATLELDIPMYELH